MNLFQWLTIPIFALLLLIELLRFRKARQSLFFWLFRCFTWFSACLAIAHPELLSELASLLGIGRGSDVLMYLLVICFVAVTFSLYAVIARLRLDLTMLVRHVAIQEAKFGKKTQDADATGDTEKIDLS